MTEAQSEEAILQFFVNGDGVRVGWATTHPEVPFTTENTVDNSLLEYGRITIALGVRQNVTIPSIRKAQYGTVAIQLFTRAGTGTLRINTLADDVRKLMENWEIRVAGVDEPVCTFTAPSSRGSTDAVWQMKLVSVSFRYDDVG